MKHWSFYLGEFPANSRYGSIERSKLGISEEETNGGQGNGKQSTISKFMMSP